MLGIMPNRLLGNIRCLNSIATCLLWLLVPIYTRSIYIYIYIIPFRNQKGLAFPQVALAVAWHGGLPGAPGTSARRVRAPWAPAGKAGSGTQAPSAQSRCSTRRSDAKGSSTRNTTWKLEAKRTFEKAKKRVLSRPHQ